MEHQSISSAFPFDSRFITIHGSRIHYIDEGEGDPVLFLHGNPTSSYLWRNIIPHLTASARCIAPDLIGMGRSDKPDIEYRFVDHSNYVEGFIREMDLKNITFVIHDWGSALGFHYAMRNEANVKGLAFMEAIIKPATWSEFPAGFRMGFRLFRTPLIGWLMIAGMNVFVEQILPKAMVRPLTEKEKDYYRAPYSRVRDRKPLWRWPNEIPIDGKPADVSAIVQSYNERLQVSELPKLLFYAHPGGIINSVMVQWCQDNLRNLKVVDIGEGIHYLQEDNPHAIGSELAAWYSRL
jgi:haloalkane dehalogenase